MDGAWLFSETDSAYFVEAIKRAVAKNNLKTLWRLLKTKFERGI